MDYIKGILKEKTLKRETESWTLYTLVIEVKDAETDKITKDNYSCFATLGTKEGSKSLKLEELKIGTEYSFGVTSNDKGKTVNFAQVPKERPEGNKATQTTSKKFGSGGELKKVELNKNCDDFVNFFINYPKECQKAKKIINPNHALGYFIRTFHQELGLSELVEWLDGKYDTVILKEAELLQNSEEIKL
jgi:hypothetical protein